MASTSRHARGDTFDQLCASTPAATGKKRVGRRRRLRHPCRRCERPTTPPITTACASVPSASNALQVTGAITRGDARRRKAWCAVLAATRLGLRITSVATVATTDRAAPLRLVNRQRPVPRPRTRGQRCSGVAVIIVLGQAEFSLQGSAVAGVLPATSILGLWVWALGMASCRQSHDKSPPARFGGRHPRLSWRREAWLDAPWARSFSVFLRLGLVVIVIRLVFQVALGSPIGEHVVFSLPVVPLPEWMASLRLGGDITWESIIFAACDGLRLAVLLACVGAANSLASPKAGC